MNNIDKVLAERGARYGDFSDHAQVAQDLQRAMQHSGSKHSGEYWSKLSVVQKQALTVIADKIARILSGDPNYDDNWIDIQGYAKLAQDRLPKQGELFKHGEIIPVERGTTVQGTLAENSRRAVQCTPSAQPEYSEVDRYAARIGGFRNDGVYPDAEGKSPDPSAGCICN